MNKVLRGGLGLAGDIAGQAGRVAGYAARQLGLGPSGEGDGATPPKDLDGATPPKDLDDATIARKVESVIFREAKAQKGSVTVNVADGVVELRGEVRNAAQIRALEAAARGIAEVKAVENLLHLPKTPAPTRADTPRRQQRQKSRTPRRTTGGRVTDDRTTDIVEDAEQTGREAAAERRGRQAAPLGSEDSEPEEPAR